MQRGARRRNRNARCRTQQRGQLVQRRRQVGAPHVAAVDHAGHHGLAGQLGHGGDGGVGAVHQVDADRLDRRAGQPGQRRPRVTEVGGDVDGRPVACRAQLVVDRLGQGGRVGAHVGHQRRLVELHPLRPVVGEQRQQLGVDRHQLLEPLDGGARPVDALAEQQEGDRPDDHRPGRNTLCQSFFQLRKHLVGVQRELGGGRDLGDDVVVVGVEPLGHLQRCDVGVAAGGREVAIQVVGHLPGPLRQRVEHHRGVEHLVVIGEGVHRHRVQAGGRQARPGVAAQRRGHLFELGATGAAGPVALGGALEFALRPDARRSDNRCGECLRGHDIRPSIGVVVTARGRAADPSAVGTRYRPQRLQPNAHSTRR